MHSKQKQTSHNLLVNMAHNITSSLNDEKLLDLILEEVISVLPAADTALLYLIDKEKRKLFLKSIVGFNKEYSELVILEPGEGLSGRVFQTKRPEIINGMEKAKEAICSMSIDNLNNYAKFCAEYPRSIMSVTLKVQNEVIGVLTVDNYHSPLEFSDEDLELLQAAADLVAVAITQAQLIQREKIYMKQLEKVHLELQKKHALLKQTLEIHRNLTDIVLQEKGFDEIINFLANMINYPTAAYNIYLKPVVVSKKALDKELPSNLMHFAEIKDMLKERKWQIICLGAAEKIYLFPIVGANNLLGFIVVWVADCKLQEIEHVALDYSSTVFALEWLKQEAVLEASRRIKGEFLQSVLSGQFDGDLIVQANQFGFEPRDYFGVVLFKKFNNHDQSSLELDMKRNYFLDMVMNSMEKERIKGVILPEKNYFAALLSCSEDEKKFFQKKIIDFAEKISGLYPELQLGIGRIYKGLINSSKSYLEAKQCYHKMDNFAFRKKIVFYGDLGIFRLI